MRRSSSHASRQYWDIPRFLLYADVHSRAHLTSMFRDKIDHNFSTSNLTVGNCLGQDHTSVEDIVGLIHKYRRDMLCLNNSVMDTIIICPEAVIIGR